MMTREASLLLQIIHETHDYIVCLKPAGLLSESHATRQNMVSSLTEQTGRTVWCVHRLDRDVGGVMVYACTREAAADLSRQIASRTLEKEYLAIAHGELQGSGELTDLLFKDSRSGRVFVVERQRKGVKQAQLTYRTEAFAQGLSLLRIRLMTGRSNQIRVQFASRHHPLVGDRKYGSSEKTPIALFSHKIAFCDPSTGNRVSFRSDPPADYPWNIFFARKDAPATAAENGRTY